MHVLPPLPLPPLLWLRACLDTAICFCHPGALQQVRRLNRLTGGKMSLGAISTPGAPKRSASSRSMHPTCSADATQTNDDKVANGDSSSSSSGDVTGDDASAEKKKAIFLDI
eukprot:COSAG05_NODE_1780_length_4098_cov_3.953488_3_plen_112_part_00